MSFIDAPQFTARVVANITITIDPDRSISFHAVGRDYQDLIADAKLWIERHILRNWRWIRGPFQAQLCCSIDGSEICLRPAGKTVRDLIADAKKRLEKIIHDLYITPKQTVAIVKSSEPRSHPWYYAIVRWSHLPRGRRRRHR